MLQLLLATSSEARPNDVGSHSALIENNRQSESFLSLRFSTPDPYFFCTEIFELQFTECAVRSCHLKHLGPHCRQWRYQEFDWGGVSTSHCNFKTCVNVPHVNKTVTDFRGCIYPLATPLLAAILFNFYSRSLHHESKSAALFL